MYSVKSESNINYTFDFNNESYWTRIRKIEAKALSAGFWGYFNG